MPEAVFQARTESESPVMEIIDQCSNIFTLVTDTTYSNHDGLMHLLVCISYHMHISGFYRNAFYQSDGDQTTIHLYYY